MSQQFMSQQFMPQQRLWAGSQASIQAGIRNLAPEHMRAVATSHLIRAGLGMPSVQITSSVKCLGFPCNRHSRWARGFWWQRLPH
jgi:hypothetical protein